MDLIYANSDKKDLGVLHDYKLDLAYGTDENDFECTVLLDNNQCKEDYILYIEGTEYGGIIDSISPDTDKNEVSYIGRTWHGILNSKVLEPDAGNDYLLLSGDANAVLSELIARMNLGNLFTVSTNESGIYIDGYEVRYSLGYDTINAMLSEYNAKMLMKWQGDKVLLWVELIRNYSIEDDFDSSQLSFSVQKNFNLCNHFVCLGQGDLKNRHVIHVFTDELGNIQPYATKDVPLQDSDYILDTSKMVMKDESEIANVYDYSSAETVENYIQLTEKPSDWDKDYPNYYQIDDDDYKAIKRNLQDVYTLQTIAPYDWGSRYKNYYYKDGDDYKSVESVSEVSYSLLATKPSDWGKNYESYFTDAKGEKKVESVTTTTYTLQKKQPSDWKKNYGNYYQTDGVDYSQVSGATKTKYVLQKRQPSDWKTNWKNYYCIYATSDYVPLGNVALYKKKAPKWRKNTFFNQSSYTVTPKWIKNGIYTKKEVTGAPTFVANKYYQKVVNEIPTWQSGTYYTKTEDVDVGFPFVPGSFYKMVLDHFATLVAGAKEKFAEIYASDKLEVSFDGTQQYDIGDIVGATENMTGIFVAQPIVKKIVTIEKNNASIEYEVKKNGN